MKHSAECSPCMQDTKQHNSTRQLRSYILSVRVHGKGPHHMLFTLATTLRSRGGALLRTLTSFYSRRIAHQPSNQAAHTSARLKSK